MTVLLVLALISFSFFPLVVEEFIEFDDLTNRGLGVWRDHDKVKTQILSPVLYHTGRVDARFNHPSGNCCNIFKVFSDKSYFRNPDIPVDFKLEFRIVLFRRIIRWKSFGQGLMTI